MKVFTSIMALMLAVGVAKSYVIPQYVALDDGMLLSIDSWDSSDTETSLLRQRRSPQGSLNFNAGMGPGGSGSAGLGYNHQVWKGGNGQSLDLGGNYMGQFGNGKPQQTLALEERIGSEKLFKELD